MDDLQILEEMIRPLARVEPQQVYDRFVVNLHEPQAPDSLVTVRNLPHDSIVIKVDSFKAPDDIFNGNAGECKRADYVLISVERKTVIYVEIKRTKDNFEQIIKQLTGAQCFIHYCREIGKAFWKKSDFLRDYQHRFVSIGHTSIAKRKTRIERSAPRHNTPNTALKIDWPNYVQFNQLSGS